MCKLVLLIILTGKERLAWNSAIKQPKGNVKETRQKNKIQKERSNPKRAASERKARGRERKSKRERERGPGIPVWMGGRKTPYCIMQINNLPTVRVGEEAPLKRAGRRARRID